jgi:outer membrane biosynthesis protein TonB
LLGDFVYVDGAIRYLDKQVLLALSHSPPTRIKNRRKHAKGQACRQSSARLSAAAKQGHIEGTVALSVGIGTDGTIGEISPISGPPDLVLSAIDAVKQWRYLPTLLNGNPSKPQLGSTQFFPSCPNLI